MMTYFFMNMYYVMAIVDKCLLSILNTKRWTRFLNSKIRSTKTENQYKNCVVTENLIGYTVSVNLGYNKTLLRVVIFLITLPVKVY